MATMILGMIGKQVADLIAQELSVQPYSEDMEFEAVANPFGSYDVVATYWAPTLHIAGSLAMAGAFAKGFNFGFSVAKALLDEEA